MSTLSLMMAARNWNNPACMASSREELRSLIAWAAVQCGIDPGRVTARRIPLMQQILVRDGSHEECVALASVVMPRLDDGFMFAEVRPA